MLSKVETIQGVVAELDGKFWGDQRPGDFPYQMNWGPIENAKICNPEFCANPTDMTYNPGNTGGNNPHHTELSKSGVKLVTVIKTVKTEYSFDFKDNG